MPDENDPLIQILETAARTDERTQNIEQDVRELKVRYIEESTKRDKRIRLLEDRVDKHGYLLNGTVVGLTAAVSALVAKLMGLLRW